MEAPFPEYATLGKEKNIKFKNSDGQEIEVKMYAKDQSLLFETEIQENMLNKKKYFSSYSIEAIKEKNQFFFFCKNIDDIFKQIDTLSTVNKLTFIQEAKNLNLVIPTNMPLAPEIKIELKEIEKNLDSKVQELNDYIIKSEKNNENNLALLIKENKELKDLINNKFDILIKENKELKEKINKMEKILTENFFTIDENCFEKIKEWIGGDKNKINFNLIFKLEVYDKDNKRFHETCYVNAPVIFIFITKNNSIFGAYCPLFNTTEEKWINDANAFIFSINLNKKYPSLQPKNNYFRGACGFHFNDINYCSFSTRKGSFGKNGIYLNKYELEGNNNEFNIKHFLVYRIDE